ncbi:MAG: hypothetical protein IPM51_03305 [Sphingobacteriaceae bacterium]|nr:hypothetical protein [Sphingobacteriaceae bacterium]
MKKLLVLAFLSLTLGFKAQTITPVTGNTNVQVDPNGTIMIGGIVRGYINNNVITNANNVQIGSIEQNGVIKNANNVIVGQFMDNYDVQDASNNVIGHLRTTLQVKTVANVVIGNWIDTTPPVWNAVAHFFFSI